MEHFQQSEWIDYGSGGSVTACILVQKDGEMTSQERKGHSRMYCIQNAVRLTFIPFSRSDYKGSTQLRHECEWNANAIIRSHV